MRETIIRGASQSEFFTPERCYILELWNCPQYKALSIAQARVSPGTTTAWHRLRGVRERYIVIAGRGRVDVGDLPSTEVVVGDLVFIPAALGSASPTLPTLTWSSTASVTPHLSPVAIRMRRAKTANGP